jgi:hypothetical protein
MFDVNKFNGCFILEQSKMQNTIVYTLKYSCRLLFFLIHLPHPIEEEKITERNTSDTVLTIVFHHLFNPFSHFYCHI